MSENAATTPTAPATEEELNMHPTPPLQPMAAEATDRVLSQDERDTMDAYFERTRGAAPVEAAMQGADREVMDSTQSGLVDDFFERTRGLSEETIDAYGSYAGSSTEQQGPVFSAPSRNTQLLNSWFQGIQNAQTLLDLSEDADATDAAMRNSRLALYQFLVESDDEGVKQRLADWELSNKALQEQLGRPLTPEERKLRASLFVSDVAKEWLEPFGGRVPYELLINPNFKTLSFNDKLLLIKRYASELNRERGLFADFGSAWRYNMENASIIDEAFYSSPAYREFSKWRIFSHEDREPMTYEEYQLRQLQNEYMNGTPSGFGGTAGNVVAGMVSPYDSPEAALGLAAAVATSALSRSGKPLEAYTFYTQGLDAFKSTSVEAAAQAAAQNPAMREHFAENIGNAVPEAAAAAVMSGVTDTLTLSMAKGVGKAIYGDWLRKADTPALTREIEDAAKRTDATEEKYVNSFQSAFLRGAGGSFLAQSADTAVSAGITQSAANRLSGNDEKSPVSAGGEAIVDNLGENILLSVGVGVLGGVGARNTTAQNVNELKDHHDRVTSEAGISESDIKDYPALGELLLSEFDPNNMVYRFSAKDLLDWIETSGMTVDDFIAKYELKEGDFANLEELAKIGGDIRMSRAHWDAYYAPTLKDGRDDIYNGLSPFLRMGDTSASINELGQKLGPEGIEALRTALEESLAQNKAREELNQHVRTSLVNRLNETSLDRPDYADYISSMDTHVFQALADDLGVDAKALYDKYAPAYKTIEDRLNLSGRAGRFDNVPATGGAFDAEENRIYLGQNAGALTIMHEWAHSYLNTLDRIAVDETLSPEGRAKVAVNLNNIKQALGYKPEDAVNERMQERFAAALLASLVGDRRDLSKRTKQDKGLEAPLYAPDYAHYNQEFSRLKRLMVNALSKAYDEHKKQMQAAYAEQRKEYQESLKAYNARKAQAKKEKRPFDEPAPEAPKEPDYNAEMALEEYRNRYDDPSFTLSKDLRDTIASYVLGDAAYERHIALTGDRLVFDPAVFEHLPEDIADLARQVAALRTQENEKLRDAYQKLEALALRTADMTAAQRTKLVKEYSDAYQREANQQTAVVDRENQILDEYRKQFMRDDIEQHGRLYIEDKAHKQALELAATEARDKAVAKARDAEIDKRYKAAEEQRTAQVEAYTKLAQNYTQFINKLASGLDNLSRLVANDNARHNKLLDRAEEQDGQLSEAEQAQMLKIEQRQRKRVDDFNQQLARLTKKYLGDYLPETGGDTPQALFTVKLDPSAEGGLSPIQPNHALAYKIESELGSLEPAFIREKGRGANQQAVLNNRALQAELKKRFPKTDKEALANAFTEEEKQAFKALGDAAYDKAINSPNTLLHVDDLNKYSYAKASEIEREQRAVAFLEQRRAEAKARAQQDVDAENAAFNEKHPKLQPEELKAFSSYVSVLNRLEKDARYNQKLRDAERNRLERNPAWNLIGYFNSMPEANRLNYDEVRATMGEVVSSRLLDLGVASKNGNLSLSTFGGNQVSKALGSLDAEFTKRFEDAVKKATTARAQIQMGSTNPKGNINRVKGQLIAEEMSKIASRDLEREITHRIMQRLMKNDKALATEYVRYNPFMAMLLHKGFTQVAKQELKLFSQIEKLFTDSRTAELKETQIKALSDELLAQENLMSFKPERFLRVAGRARDNAHKLVSTMFEDQRRVSQVANNLVVSLINHQAARDGVARVRELDRKILRLKALSRRKADNLARRYDSETVQLMQVAMARLGIISKDKGLLARDQISKYGSEQSQRLLERIESDARFTGDFKQKSLPELESAIKTLEYLREYAKAVNRVRNGKEYKQAASLVAEAVKSLQENNNPERTEAEVQRAMGLTEEQIKANEGVGRGLTPEGHELLKRDISTSVRSALVRVEQFCHKLDGGKENGPMWRLLYKPIRDAYDKAAMHSAKVADKLGHMMQDLGTELNNIKRIEAPELKRSDDGTYIVFGDSRKHKDAGGWELMGFLVHIGNESNFEKLLGGYHITREQFQAFFDRACNEGIITKKMMDTLQAVWDENKTPFKRVQQAYYRTKGHFVKDIEARKIETPWGTYEGGYAPAVVDRDIASPRTDYASDIDNLLNPQGLDDYLGNPGFLQERTNIKEPLDLDIGITLRTTLNAVHYGYMLEPVMRSYDLLNNKDLGFRTALEMYAPRFYDDVYRQFLSRALRNSAENNPNYGRGWRVLDAVTKNIGISYMAGNLINVAQNITNLSVLAARVPPWHIARAVMMMASHPFQMRRLAMQQSEFINQRFTTYKTRNLRDVLRIEEKRARADGSILGKAELRRAQASQFMQQHGYFLQTFTQQLIDTVSWVSARDYATRKGMSADEAIAYADTAVRETQGSLDALDRTNVEAGHPALRMFTQFTSYFNTLANLSMVELKRAFGNDRTRMEKAVAAARLFVTVWVIPAILSDWIAQWMKGNEVFSDDEEASEIIWAHGVLPVIKTATAMVPVGGSAINYMIGEATGEQQFSYGGFLGMPATVTAAQNAFTTVTDIARGEEPNNLWRDTLTATGIITGIPVGTFIGRRLDYVDKIEVDEASEVFRLGISGQLSDEERDSL